MKTIIHDLDDSVFEAYFPELAAARQLSISSQSGGSDPSAVILSPSHPPRPCIGCFGCWIKTPGSCVLPDSYQEMGRLLSRTSELILISRCCYGGYSPFVKNVLDRSIGYIQPFFRIVGGEMHHIMRYDNHMALSAHFYGEDITEREKETAINLVNGNGVNFGTSHNAAHFYETPEQMRGNLL